MSGPVANNIFKASGVIAAAAGGLNWDSTILTALTNLTVTVQNVGGANYYYINGVRQQTLNLLEGFTYKFDQSDSSNSNHPFRFSTTSGGTHSGGSEYTTGVTTSGTPGNAGAYTQIVVALDAPTLYYYCTNHNYMGGTANTVSETVEANRGYWIDTTSTTCTITLPSSPSKGDQIILVDYARTWGTNKITINSNGSNYQGDPDTFTVEYSTSGEVLNIVYSDGTKGWIPQDDDEVADVPVAPPTQKAIFGFGSIYSSGVRQNVTNLVNSSGVVATDTAGVGSARSALSALGYGGDKGIFAYGNTNKSNLVSNQGVIASDINSVGTNKNGGSGVTIGGDKGVFAFGTNPISNKVSNQGVIASDTTGVGTGRQGIAAVEYGGDKGVFAFGEVSGGALVNTRNLVSNTGVIASDVSGAGTARYGVAGCSYGSSGTAIYAFGYIASGAINPSNLVSNTGVVASDTSGVGTARTFLAASRYGGDKGIFGFGAPVPAVQNVTNKINSSGVVASDTTGVGTARYELAACGFSSSA